MKVLVKKVNKHTGEGVVQPPLKKNKSAQNFCFIQYTNIFKMVYPLKKFSRRIRESDHVL